MSHRTTLIVGTQPEHSSRETVNGTAQTVQPDWACTGLVANARVDIDGFLKRLLVLAVCLFNVYIGWLFIEPIRTGPVWDLPQFYFAGKLVRSGQASRLYHKEAYDLLIAAMRREDTDRKADKGSIYFNRPAFEAPLFVPLSFLPFMAAKWTAVALNLLLLGVLVWKLPQWFPVPIASRMWLFVFMPFLFSVAFGQDTLLLTLIIAAGFALAVRGDKDVAAGALLALSGFKPHLILVVPVAIAAARRWKLLTSFLLTGCALVAFSALLVGPAGVREWLALLTAPTTDVNPEMMGNLRAIGLHLGVPLALATGVAALLAFCWILKRGSFREKFAAALIMGPLLSPHTFPQDYSVMAVAGLIAFPTPALYALFLPWPYFYSTMGKDMLPLIFVCVGCLIGIAVKRWISEPSDQAIKVNEPPAVAGPVTVIEKVLSRCADSSDADAGHCHIVRSRGQMGC